MEVRVACFAARHHHGRMVGVRINRRLVLCTRCEAAEGCTRFGTQVWLRDVLRKRSVALARGIALLLARPRSPPPPRPPIARARSPDRPPSRSAVVTLPPQGEALREYSGARKSGRTVHEVGAASWPWAPENSATDRTIQPCACVRARALCAHPCVRVARASARVRTCVRRCVRVRARV